MMFVKKRCAFSSGIPQRPCIFLMTKEGNVGIIKITGIYCEDIIPLCCWSAFSER